MAQTAFSVPLSSIGYWEQRLASHGVPVERTGTRFGLEEVLTFADPDGMRLEFAAHADAGPAKASRRADVPAEHALRGFFGVTLLERSGESTANFLKVLGFSKTAEAGPRQRFAVKGDAAGRHIDLVVDPNAGHGRLGAGSVHHIALRATDDVDQLAWREEIGKHVEVTPVMDRTYFHSIYFREPGGVLFELATDPPGFTLDETIESLGEELRVPAWLESRRGEIEKRLTPLDSGHSGEARTTVAR